MKTTYLGSVRNLFAYLIFSCVGLFSAATLSAQSAGWEALLANDFMAARQAFDESLQKDSTQREELLGALFLADIFKDTERYQRLGKKLLYSHPEPILWRAFRNALPGEALYTDWFESLNPDQKAYGPIRMYASLAKLDETNRKDRSKARKKRLTYEEGTALLMPLLQKDGWAILGPFQNIGGGGLEKVYPPETDGYDPQASYTNAHDLPLQWFSPPFPTLRTGLEFSSVLPGGKHMSTYYARKAFEMEQAGQLDLAITRNNPMKVWINGTLVFSTDEPMGFYADGETINLDLEKGQYEILVKMARKENWYGSARGLFALRYSAPTYGDESSIFMLRALETGGSEKALKPIPGKLNNPGNLKSFSVVEEGLLSANLARLGEGEFAWSEYYLLVRLANRMGKTRVVEEAMVALQKEHPDQVYLQLLLASVYQQNLNRNMAIRMVSQIDLEKTPHYDLLMKELEEVDEDLQEDEYEEKMDQIKAIAPSNRDFVQSYLRYYRGKKDSTTLYAFRDETLTAYPEMAYLFDEEDGEEFVNKGKKKKNKKEKKPQYNQDKKKKWFEEALEYRPFSRNLYQEKVEELLEEKEYETAAKIAQQGLKVSPYDPKLWELLGDTQEGLSQTDSALNCFRRSMQYRSAAGRNYYYGSNPLKKKIERLGEKNEATDFFQKKTLADILAERDLWEETYKDQDAVILLRTADYLINEYGGGEARQSFALLINSENGINPWTEENFSYLGSNVKVQHIKPDSSILKPDMRGTYAVFKDLAPGDLIYVEGTRVLNDVFENGRTYGVGDYFSLRGGSMFINPIYYQKLEIAVPEGSPIQYQSFNAPDLKEKRLAEGFDFYRWEWRFTPELVEEDGAFRKWAAAPDIQFTNAQDWSWLVNWYDDLTRTKLEPNYYIQNLYGEIVKEGMQDEEIIRAIYNYITKEIKYSSVSFLQSNFIPQAPELTCSGGIGDCKDVATLMIALLRMADIESYYVLVRAIYNYITKEIKYSSVSFLQ
ncbi:MAG: transglutaminase-like domain-containing protein, partial [Bacteroidota bacterium]